MKNKNSGGFIKMVIVVVGTLVLLKYIYNVDVIGFLTQGRFRELLDQFYSLGTKGWARYSGAVIKIWSYVFEFVKNIFNKG